MNRNNPDVFRYRYQKESELSLGMESGEPDTSPTFEEYEIEVVRQEAEDLIDRVRDAIYEREKEGYLDVDTVVMSVEDYRLLDAYAGYTHNSPAEALIPAGDIIALPDADLEVVIPNKDRMMELFEEEQSD